MKPDVLVRELSVWILKVVEHETGNDRANSDEYNRWDVFSFGKKMGPWLKESKMGWEAIGGVQLLRELG